MKVTEVAITRKFNLGNYQTIDYHVEASLDQNELSINTLFALEKVINDYWENRTKALISTAKKEEAKPQ